MNKHLTLLVFLLISTVGFANCTNAYASAGYGLSHTKKSMEANNFEHQQYYAERALTAFEKIRDQNESCGCPEAKDPILDGIQNLKIALSQDEWDNARYYTKKALQNAEQVLNKLDVCTMDGFAETPQESEVGEVSLSEEVSPNVNSDDTDMWEVKLSFKNAAEKDIAALENTIRELGALFECDRALRIFRDRETKSEAELRTESLESVRSFYMSQVVSLHNKALFAMLECSKK